MKKNGMLTYQHASVSLFRTAGWLQSMFDTALRPHDLSSQQLRVLSVLMEQPEGTATVGELRDSMTDPNSNISRLLNKLVDKGYIEKQREKDDQRVVTIRITEAGRSITHSGRTSIAGEVDIWSRLTLEEAETLATLLDRLRGA